jgi:hypothetical protein
MAAFGYVAPPIGRCPHMRNEASGRKCTRQANSNADWRQHQTLVKNHECDTAALRAEGQPNA